MRLMITTFAVLSLAASTASASGSEWLDAIRRELDARAGDDRFSGVLLVAREGAVLLHEARGFGDAERRVALTVDSSFNLGSVSKMFTAVAVAQLAQEGKLRFTDTIGRHLPDYPNRDAAERVTLHQLLTHTGGVGNFFGPGYDEKRDGLLRVADYLPLFASERLVFEPGARWEYSNGGYVVLGAIVEKVSGLDYHEYVRTHILEPAGMTHTGFPLKVQPAPHAAVGLTRRERMAPSPAPPATPPASAPRRPNTDRLPGRGSPAGGGYATAADLVRFANALLGHRLLDRESTELVLAGKVDAPRGRYGYGFGERWMEGKRVVGHNGGFPGVNAEFHILPADNTVVVVLSNYDPPAASQLAEAVLLSLR